MAAAVFLHNAIFTADPPSTPSVAHRSPSARRAPHDRQLSSVSSVTLQTSTSEHSHPTEPLIHPEHSESTVYLDLLARQPTHPSSPAPAGSGLTLRGDPVTPRERRILYGQAVRKRLRKLRWTMRALGVVIGGWATYNTVRYYLSAWLNHFRERQVIALVLGSCTALCVSCRIVSALVSVSAPYFRSYHRPRPKYVLFQGFLHYSSSLCLFAPAVVNVILVFLWRNSSNTNTLHGRCHWDIDVVWSGLGDQCDRSPAWRFWLAGSLVRLVITAMFLFAYHVVSYKYMITRRPSHRRQSIFRHSAASFPSVSNATTTSSRTLRPMAAVPNAATVVSFAPNDGRSHVSRDRSGSSSDGEARALRSSRSRIMAGDISPPGSSVVRRAGSTHSPRSASGARQEGIARSVSPSSSEDDTIEALDERYGSSTGRVTGGYASVPLQSPSYSDGRSSWDPVPDSDLNSFAAHFRALVEQVSRETDEAADYPEIDRYEFPVGGPRNDAHVVGRTIHRMPTIESLGSHEVMSLASMSAAGGFSRPSTRSNTVSNVDAPHSRSASRANSLDAALSLSVTVDGLTNNGINGDRVSEIGELATTPSSTTSINHPGLLGTRSTSTSYHSAASGQSEEPEK